jgi:hypothetical protein
MFYLFEIEKECLNETNAFLFFHLVAIISKTKITSSDLSFRDKILNYFYIGLLYLMCKIMSHLCVFNLRL